MNGCTSRRSVVLGAAGVDQGETVAELGGQRVGVVARHGQAGARVGAVLGEGPDDQQATRRERAPHLGDVRRALLVLDEEVEDGPVVPDVVLLVEGVR